ncbi:hypothetical protein [Geodermatophilus sp. SYSU D01176]
MPTLPPGGVVTLPLPEGSRLWVDAFDPWTVVGWETPAGELRGLQVAFGQAWSSSLAGVLSGSSEPDEDAFRPPRLDDGWARVAILEALRTMSADRLSPHDLCIDLALAWTTVGQLEMAALWLELAEDRLSDWVQRRATGRLPAQAAPIVMEAIDLALRLQPGIDGDALVPRAQDPDVGQPARPDLTALVNSVASGWAAPSKDSLEGDGALVQAWAAHRLAEAARGSGAQAAARLLDGRAVDYIAEGRGSATDRRFKTLQAALRRQSETEALTLAEIAAVHGLSGSIEDELRFRPTGFDLARAQARSGDVDQAREALLAARAIYAREGLESRVDECDRALAELTESASTVTSWVQSVEEVLSSWAVKLREDSALARAFRAMPSRDQAAEQDTFVLDDRAFTDLVGRPHRENDRLPSLHLQVKDTPPRLRAELVLPAVLDPAVTAITVVASTATWEVRIPLQLDDRSDASFEGGGALPRMGQSAVPTLRVEVTRRAG